MRQRLGFGKYGFGNTILTGALGDTTDPTVQGVTLGV